MGGLHKTVSGVSALTREQSQLPQRATETETVVVSGRGRGWGGGGQLPCPPRRTATGLLMHPPVPLPVLPPYPVLEHGFAPPPPPRDHDDCLEGAMLPPSACLSGLPMGVHETCTSSLTCVQSVDAVRRRSTTCPRCRPCAHAAVNIKGGGGEGWNGAVDLSNGGANPGGKCHVSVDQCHLTVFGYTRADTQKKYIFFRVSHE